MAGGEHIRDLLANATGNPNANIEKPPQTDDPMGVPTYSGTKAPCDCEEDKDPCEYLLMTPEQKLQYRCEKLREKKAARLKCAAFKKEWGPCIKSMLPKPKKATKRRTATTAKRRTYRRKTPAMKKPAPRRRFA